MYLLSISEFHQLLKFPILVHHFIEHQSEDKSLTFSDFLNMHYSNANVVKDDYAKDMKLPFKTSLVNLIAHFVAMEVELKDIYIHQHVRTLTFAKLDCNIPLGYTSAVFQPPKMI